MSPSLQLAGSQYQYISLLSVVLAPASCLYRCPHHLSFLWQGKVFYAEERGTEHEELCCKNQYRAIDNPLWRYRHSYCSEEDCCREWCYTHILFHRHSVFLVVVITLSLSLKIHRHNLCWISIWLPLGGIITDICTSNCTPCKNKLFL